MDDHSIAARLWGQAPSFDNIVQWDYAARAGIADLEIPSRRDATFYIQQINHHNLHRVLVIPCGPGDLVFPLSTCDLTARFEDIEPAMISLCRSQIVRANAEQRFIAHIGDALEYRGSGDFDGIIIPCEGLQRFPIEDQLKILSVQGARLLDRGVIIVDSIVIGGRRSKSSDIPYYYDPEIADGVWVFERRQTAADRSLTRWRKQDHGAGSVHLAHVYALEGPDGVQFGRSEVTLFTLPSDTALSAIGFSAVTECCDYSGGQFCEDAPRRLIVLRKETHDGRRP